MPEYSDPLALDSVLSVAGLTAYLQLLLEEDPQLQQVWVTGEVSSSNRHRSGLFFTLQDPDGKAAINCVVWNSGLDRLIALPEPGANLVILGRIVLYPQRGAYQLTVWQSIPAGEGLRALRYRQLRSRLEAEGLFDAGRKRSLPAHPQIIAVVTSPQAAAWGDIQRTLTHRYPGLRVLLSPAMVQGEQAPDSIVRAIHRVERDGRAEVLVLSRGGGAVEDLACFNDERVVRAVAECLIPVVAGIGHQRDESLADLAADICAHTPTAAAERVVPPLAAVYGEHRDRIDQLQRAMDRQFHDSMGQVHHWRERLERLHLDHRLRQQKQALAWLRQRVIQSTRHLLDQQAQRCHLLQQTLQTLDPTAVLQRGYAVVRQADGEILRSPQSLAPGDRLQIQLAQGEVWVEVAEPSRDSL